MVGPKTIAVRWGLVTFNSRLICCISATLGSYRCQMLLEQNFWKLGDHFVWIYLNEETFNLCQTFLHLRLRSCQFPALQSFPLAQHAFPDSILAHSVLMVHLVQYQDFHQLKTLADYLFHLQQCHYRFPQNLNIQWRNPKKSEKE
jgi:hypothetical protein